MKGTLAIRWTLVVLGAIGLIVLGTVVLGGDGTGGDCCDARAEGLLPEWINRLRVVNEAIEARDLSRASRTWTDAWGAALGSRRWDALIATGDAALRIGELRGLALPGAGADARRAYHAALFRAYGERSAEGVLRSAEAMARMGDREMAGAALQLARRLAGPATDAEVRQWIERDITRIANHLTVSVSSSAPIAGLPGAAERPC